MPPRGSRGRGRGRAREPVEEKEAVLDPILNQLTDISVNESQPGTATSANRAAGPSGEGAKPAASKFKPRMVKRVAKVEPDAEEEDSGRTAGGAGGRGRGRGRGGGDRGGRGRAEIVMTASGAFAMGPAEASTRRTVQGPSRSGMRRIDNSIMPTDERSRTATSGTTTPWEGRPGEALELYSDIDEGGSDGPDDNFATTTVAPSLPWDPKRVAERERLVQARNEKLLKLAQTKLKKENTDLPNDSKPSSLPIRESTTTTTVSDSSVPLKDEHLNDQDENQKRDVKLKKEQLEEISNVGKQFTQRQPAIKKAPNPEPTSTSRAEAASSNGEAAATYYVFQFPRHFPQFRDPSNDVIGEEPPAEPQKAAAPGPRMVKKKKKPGLDDWLGWGKGGKRTEIMGVPPSETGDDSVQGQIGELVIRRSGRVQMIIANVAYDVLPGAKPTFHQEIAVIDPKPDSQLRAMFVLGSTQDKFIVVPDVSTLLKREQALAPTS
ncbi:hypothetical protein PTTG_00181 [Puccinia triticina 1-1 BBBD Race 1]|uniref:DNA-directed RNA polymerase III subunit RPC4 n=1 Tax=Puccinia triticina (isolate 1-1 / race 1 (BBBD)) TaxID=630390 RepID=A0A180GYM3_PUCT1|nr:hypothetical protein PTTG_00181 [Puccinia triticina 1-1 BBBD Race 1]